MKKGILAALALVAFASCTKEVCTTCTESSGYSQEFCGTPDQVDEFQNLLYQGGAASGQSWSCN